MAPPRFKLPAFALPFVTRSLRGGRRRRFMMLSLVFAFLTLLTGSWLALGSGAMEREFRTGVGLERDQWERERLEFTLIAHDRVDHEQMENARQAVLEVGPRNARLQGHGYEWDYRVQSSLDEAHSYLMEAAHAPAGRGSHRELRARARAMLGDDFQPRTFDDPYENTWYFDYGDPDSVERLESIIEKRGVPTVELYHSPLGVKDALMLIGVLAGGVLSLLLLVVAPLLVGVQQAQEVHENTLMPLTGTFMSPKQLSLGLASGPWSIVAIFAIPQAILFVLMALGVGHVGAGLAMLTTTMAAAALFTVLAQLVGQLAGKQRTPGIIGIALLIVGGAAWFAGMGVGLNLDESREMAATLSLIPQASSMHFLRQTFVPAQLGGAATMNALLSAGVGAVGAMVLAVIALRALSAKISGKYGPLLGRWEALVGAVTCMVLVMLALPFPEAVPNYRAEQTSLLFYFGSLAIMALPLGILMMARVPTGDVPTKLRRVPVLRLLGELWAFTGFHFLLCLPFLHQVEVLQPISLLYLMWSVTLVGLLAIRVASVPPRVLGTIWALFCCVALVVGYVHAIAWAADTHMDVTDVFALSNLSPFLGLIQAGLTVWVPLSLIRVMKKNLASLSAKAA